MSGYPKKKARRWTGFQCVHVNLLLHISRTAQLYLRIGIGWSDGSSKIGKYTGDADSTGRECSGCKGGSGSRVQSDDTCSVVDLNGTSKGGGSCTAADACILDFQQ